MDIKLRDIILNNQFKLVGLTGGAGSGKSTLSVEMGFPTYHLDDSFIGDSTYRKDLLTKKRLSSQQDYIDACNMYNWWDWEQAERNILIESSNYKNVVVEGALLGSDHMLNQYDFIIYVDVPPEIRFNRLQKRDGHKRSFHELLDRFMITEYSETLYYKSMFHRYGDKILVIGDDHKTSSGLVRFPESLSIPFRLELP